MDLNKTQVTEKSLVNSPGKSKTLCLTHKFYNFSIEKCFLECAKLEEKDEKIQKFSDQVSSSSNLISKF